MALLNALLEILHAWTPAFAQSRSGDRAVDQALGSLLALGRRTLSRSLWALGRQHQAVDDGGIRCRRGRKFGHFAPIKPPQLDDDSRPGD